MPELPETETIARDLNASVRHAVIANTVVLRADVLREMNVDSLIERTRNATIERVWRRAKLIVLDLRKSEGLTHIVVQPRFTGGLLIEEAQPPAVPLTHITVTFNLQDGRRLHYRDVRRLGTVSLMSAERFVKYSESLGPEPLDPAFSSEDVSALVRSSSRPIKAVLMDQRLLAGVGNIYANEALWRAGIDPSRSASSLSPEQCVTLFDALQSILRASIDARGTSFRDYRDARGERGRYVEQLQAYGREGLSCAKCGRKLIGTHAIDGRATVFCAYCQR